ncbi:hypothetical protein [Streptomyces flavidovirens]
MDWRVDPLIELGDLGTGVDTDRPRLLTGGVYSAAALILPDETWWDATAEPPAEEPAAKKRVGRGDVETVREPALAFSRMDQRRGGGHGLAGGRRVPES